MSPWPHLGALAHRFSPASPDLPKNWEDLPVDESIPVISGWSPARMSQYLVQNGVKETVAKVFFDQVMIHYFVAKISLHPVQCFLLLN